MHLVTIIHYYCQEKLYEIWKVESFSEEENEQGESGRFQSDFSQAI